MCVCNINISAIYNTVCALWRLYICHQIAVSCVTRCNHETSCNALYQTEMAHQIPYSFDFILLRTMSNY